MRCRIIAIIIINIIVAAAHSLQSLVKFSMFGLTEIRGERQDLCPFSTRKFYAFSVWESPKPLGIFIERYCKFGTQDELSVCRCGIMRWRFLIFIASLYTPLH